MYCEPIRTETSLEVDEDEQKLHTESTPAFVVASKPVLDAQGPALALVPPLPSPEPASSSQIETATAVVPPFAVSQGSTVAAPGKYDWLFPLGSRVSILAVAASCVISYFCLHSLTGFYYWQVTGVQHDFYMHSAHNASLIGVLTAVLCFIAYLKSFVGLKAGAVTWTARVALGLAIVGVGTLTEGFAGALYSLGICGLFLLMHGLGSYVHRALPTTFRFKRALLLNGLVCSPAALLFIYSMLTRVQHSSDYSPTYSDYSGSEIGFYFGLMAAMMGLATYVVSRSARTSEAKPLITLGILQQSPLLLGFCMQILGMSALADAGPYLVSGLCTLLSAVSVIAVSASAAAFVNGRRHRRQMAKSGGYVF